MIGALPVIGASATDPTRQRHIGSLRVASARLLSMASTARMLCCFCGEPTETDDVDPWDYVQLSVTFPEIEDTSTQGLGAHRECLKSALSDGFPLDGPS